MCSYLDKWLKKFKGKPENPNLRVFNQGGGLKEPYKACPPIHIMEERNRKLHPNLHPTQHEYRMKDDIRLMIPTEGIMPMGSARGVPGYGLIHPNTISAAFFAEIWGGSARLFIWCHVSGT